MKVKEINRHLTPIKNSLIPLSNINWESVLPFIDPFISILQCPQISHGCDRDCQYCWISLLTVKLIYLKNHNIFYIKRGLIIKIGEIIFFKVCAGCLYRKSFILAFNSVYYKCLSYSKISINDGFHDNMYRNWSQEWSLFIKNKNYLHFFFFENLFCKGLIIKLLGRLCFFPLRQNFFLHINKNLIFFSLKTAD